MVSGWSVSDPSNPLQAAHLRLEKSPSFHASVRAWEGKRRAGQAWRQVVANASANINRIPSGYAGAKIAEPSPPGLAVRYAEPGEVADVARRKETHGEKAIRQRIDVCRIAPGQKVRLSHFDTEWGGGDLRDRCTKRELESLLTQDVSRLAKAQDLLYADASRVAAGRLSGDGCGRQGQHDQARHVGSESDRLRGRQLQAARRRRSSTQFFLALRQALPERGAHRHL